MKYSRIIGTAWIIFALYNLFFGLNNIYEYSTPGVLWLYMIPIWITFGKIFLGTMSVIIGISILKNNPYCQQLLIPFLGVLLMYILIDSIKLGPDVFLNYGSNIILLLLAFITVKFSRNSTLTAITIINKKRVVIIIIIGLLPYFLDGWLNYDWFNFLH